MKTCYYFAINLQYVVKEIQLAWQLTELKLLKFPALFVMYLLLSIPERRKTNYYLLSHKSIESDKGFSEPSITHLEGLNSELR